MGEEMSDGIVELPGGFQVDGELIRQVELREMSGEEEEIILDRRKQEGGKGKTLKSGPERMTEILARCTVKVGEKTCEANRSPETASTKPFWDLWSNALAGDRAVAVIRLRQLSLGDSYVFSETCPMCKREMQRVSFDLQDVKVDPYFDWIEDELTAEGLDPEEDSEAFNHAAEERRRELLLQDKHEIKTPGGKSVTYKLLRRIDEERLSQTLEKGTEAILSAIIAAHVTAIDGEALNSLKDKRIKFMSSRDRDFLRHHFDKAGGGPDTNIEIHCDNQECGHVFWRKLDTSKPGFFIRSVS